MFNRPRCRDWTPLATQQLRLRNLIQITGHNIVCNQKCQLYFTLHSTAMSAPFYTSEKIDSHGGNLVSWPEINSQMILKSQSHCVCIRIWEHHIKSFGKLTISSEESNIDNETNDRMLFIWGVYFSGLILLTKRSDAKFLTNTLLFHMHGGCFVSPTSLTQETMQKQLKLTYKQDQGILSSTSSSTTTPTNSPKMLQFNEIIFKKKSTSTKSCDILNNYISNNLTNDLEISPKNIEFQINSPRTSRSCSPVREQCLTKTNDLCRDLLGMLKVRYLDKKFYNTEIRSSYNLDKLLKLQEKQRKFKHKNEDAKEIIEKICMKSAYCLNLDLITTNRNLYYHYRSQQRGNPSMGRTLNRLLFQDTFIKPEDLLKGQELRRNIETGKFRLRLLTQERDKIKFNIRKLEKKLTTIQDNNIELESWLMTSYRNLGREKDILKQQKITLNKRNEILLKHRNGLAFRRTQLLNELKDIYQIDIKKNSKFSINNIIIPESKNILKNDRLSDGDFISWDLITPVSLSVAFGYVAHVVQICSIILNLPLRNPIIHEGSRSRIVDIIKEIPNSAREFPLYSRTNPPPKAVLYAIYLLNQNIAQLNYQFNGIRCDLRATLPNLLRLLTGPLTSYSYLNKDDDDDSNSNTITSPTETAKILDEQNQTISISGSSIDLNIPVPPSNIHIMSKPVGIVDTKINEQRISRSVGSYSDENLLAVHGGRSFYSSEPILTLQTVHLSNFEDMGDI